MLENQYKDKENVFKKTNQCHVRKSIFTQRKRVEEN